MLYLPDTHAIYWHALGSKRLSAAAREALEEVVAGRACMIVSCIVLAELFFLMRKFGHEAEHSGLMARFERSSVCQIEPVTSDDIKQLRDFPEIPEMHDRLIAIQANRLGAVVITRDQELQASPQVRCIW